VYIFNFVVFIYLYLYILARSGGILLGEWMFLSYNFEHATIVYMCFFFLVLFFYKFDIYYSFMLLIYWFCIGMLLGGQWAMYSLRWRFFWNNDAVELIILIIFMFCLWLFHFRGLFFFSKSILYIYFCFNVVLLLKRGFFLSNHNTFQVERVFCIYFFLVSHLSLFCFILFLWVLFFKLIIFFNLLNLFYFFFHNLVFWIFFFFIKFFFIQNSFFTFCVNAFFYNISFYHFWMKDVVRLYYYDFLFYDYNLDFIDINIYFTSKLIYFVLFHIYYTLIFFLIFIIL
jgi:hypothetical protein